MSRTSIPFHNELQTYLENLREKFFEAIGNYMEKGYKFVRIKSIKTSEQEKFLRSYQKMFLLQSAGLFFMSVSGIYFTKLTLKKKVLNEKELKSLLLKAGLVSGLGATLTLNAFVLNSRQKVLERAGVYGKQFEAIVKAITPENLQQMIE